MKDQLAYADLIYRRLEELYHQDAIGNDLVELFQFLINEWTEEEAIHFQTWFTRCAYLANKYQLDRDSKRSLHIFRKYKMGQTVPFEEKDLKAMGIYALTRLTEARTGRSPGRLFSSLDVSHLFEKVEKRKVKFKPIIKALALAWDRDHRVLRFIDEGRPEDERIARFDVPEKNEMFAGDLNHIAEKDLFPLPVNLVDVEIDDGGVCEPAGLSIEPDYLIDVTSISACYQPDGIRPASYLIHKLLPPDPSFYLLRGSIVNYLLDELIYDPKLDFDTVVKKIFRVSPLSFATMVDADLRKLLVDLRMHFEHLKDTIATIFPAEQIDPEGIFLEPAYFSPAYGIQGRLDLLNLTPDSDQAKIIELKSGKPFRANKYGLNSSHYIQTLLYDMMVNAAYKSKYKSRCYILYSVKEQDRLCYAPPIRSHQLEALHVRNILVSIESSLCSLASDPSPLIQLINKYRHPGITGFLAADLERLTTAIEGLDDANLAYYTSFIGFLSREQRLAKTGSNHNGIRKGFASLWTDPVRHKDDNFQVLRGLSIFENEAASDNPTITFKRGEQTNPLANFRRGDIIVVYPGDLEYDPTNEQFIRGKIIRLNSKEVRIRLRSTQRNLTIFQKYSTWNIEKDFLDSSFRSLFGAMTRFLELPVEQRAKWLGKIEPARPDSEKFWDLPKDLTLEQTGTLNRMLNAEDLFLLWGPPGTGKTSVMLRNYVDQIMRFTEESILILSYTNRAVDEICQVLTGLEGTPASDFIRVGSRYATDERYRPYLFSNRVGQLETRAEVVEMIRENRVTVGTVASMLGSKDILQLKKYDRLIIDEASQMLEPHLIGLVPLFKKVVMVGDHKQLPAVVVQPAEESRIDHQELNKLGITDAGESLFERMFKQMKSNGWDHSYDLLTAQGRMHKDIMRFVSIMFYDGNLELLKIAGIKEKLSQSMPDFITKVDPLHNQWSKSPRIQFVPVDGKSALHARKSCEQEAIACVEWIRDLLGRNGIGLEDVKPDLIGIITPFRAQIAQINVLLAEEYGDQILEKITIDTVERYQGGAREIILMSPVATHPNTLELGSAYNADGIDRKLNVALSRARQLIVIFGDPEVLRKKKEYRELEDYTRSLSSYKSSSSMDVRY